MFIKKKTITMELSECGRILISSDRRLYALECFYCESIFTQWESFIEHIKDAHTHGITSIVEEVRNSAKRGKSIHDDHDVNGSELERENAQNEILTEIRLMKSVDVDESESLLETYLDENFKLPQVDGERRLCCEKDALDQNANEPINMNITDQEEMSTAAPLSPCETVKDENENVSSNNNNANHDVTYKGHDEHTSKCERNATIRSRTDAFPCPHCSKIFTKRNYLNVHSRRHTKDFAYKCSLCDKRTVTSTDMTTHMRVHTGEKPYVCDTCGKSFKTCSVLNAHRRKHERPQFKCLFCPKSYYSNHDLKNHTNVHLNKREHKCEFCEKAYTSAKILYSHKMHSHFELRRTFCKICKRCFTLIDYHMKSVHGVIDNVNGMETKLKTA